MDDSPPKEQLMSCKGQTPTTSKFSIGHRGAPLMFPEHTVESNIAAARMGAGILERDVTFTADKELVCYTEEEIVCINPKASWLQLSGGDIVIHVHELIPAPQATSYVSCIPDWSERKVSRLHNSHMILNSEGFLVGGEYKIRVQDLQIADIVNKQMIDLSTFLIQNNIFVTTHNELLGISCAENELLFIKNQTFTCN